MKTYTVFQQYIWLVSTIHRAGKITLEEINRKWERSSLSDGEPIARTTFNRHKDAIQSMFGIIIECDRRDGFKYFISNEAELRDDNIQNWMLNTMSVNNLLTESKAVHDRILLEDIPSDGEKLHTFIEAMKQGHKVYIRYRKYESDHDTELRVEPYFVKVFNRRWYAFVHNPDRDFIFPLAIDRILELNMLEDKFSFPVDFSPKHFVKDNYGVVVNEWVDVSRVVIRAFGKEVYYLRDLPLHNSQKEIATGDDWADFEYNLKVTADFVTPLVARGPSIKVLEPEELVDAVWFEHHDAQMLYEE